MNLMAERLNRGFSRVDFAKQLDVPTHVLRYAERGGRPSPENAKKIADYFGVAVTQLWPLEEPVAR